MSMELEVYVSKFLKDWYHDHPDVYVTMRGRHNIKLNLKSMLGSLERAKAKLPKIDMGEIINLHGRV